MNCPDKPGYILQFVDKIYDNSAQIEPQHVALVLATLAAGARLDDDTQRCKSGVHSSASCLDTTSSRLSLEFYRKAKMALAGAPVQSRPDYCTLFAVVRLVSSIMYRDAKIPDVVCIDLVFGSFDGFQRCGKASLGHGPTCGQNGDECVYPPISFVDPDLTRLSARAQSRSHVQVYSGKRSV